MSQAVIHITGDDSDNDEVTNASVSALHAGYDWKVILLMDRREFNHTGFIDQVKDRIDKHFNGTSPLDRNGRYSYPLYCEKQTLSCADYMFVARKVSIANGKVLDERVFDLIIERKEVHDLQACLIQPSLKFKPLSFFEAQMFKLQQCEIPRKLFLMEGNEDDPRGSFHENYHGYKNERENRLKRVKTMRLQLENGEYHGISLESTRNKNESVQYLIDQMVDLKERFNPMQPPNRTMMDVKERVNEGMKGATFEEYLRLRRMKGIGDSKAMKAIMDTNNSWDKSFISPACTSKNKKWKSTLEDRATFYVSPAQRQGKEEYIRALVNRATSHANQRQNDQTPSQILNTGSTETSIRRTISPSRMGVSSLARSQSLTAGRLDIISSRNDLSGGSGLGLGGFQLHSSPVNRVTYRSPVTYMNTNTNKKQRRNDQASSQIPKNGSTAASTQRRSENTTDPSPGQRRHIDPVTSQRTTNTTLEVSTSDRSQAESRANHNVTTTFSLDEGQFQINRNSHGSSSVASISYQDDILKAISDSLVEPSQRNKNLLCSSVAASIFRQEDILKAMRDSLDEPFKKKET